ncbi:MAG: efflux RND transporter periplasmic adaptor subunit, partial [Bacteroidaceae bacterium]|nr:efflux RND transporter periplasmic adaptor subunit [Bacteroidaceae bacterium]
MKKFFKIAALVIIAILFIGTFVYLYQKSRPKINQYEILTSKNKNIEKTTIVTGSVEPRDQVLIKPQISGIISDLYKHAGDKVKKGEVIAKVKVIPEMSSLNAAENRVRLAKISIDQAKRDMDRNEKLFKDKLISSEDAEKTRMAYKQTKEELTSSEDNLNIVKEGISRSNANYSTTLIRSTIDGLILDIPVKVGNSVVMSNTFNDGTTIATVANMSDLIFKGNIDETEVGNIHEGMPVKITSGALQTQVFSAFLEYISPEVNSSNGANQFEIKAAVHIPEGIKMRAGYSANAEIVLQRANNVISVPEGAVEFSNDSTFVYILKKNEKTQVFERRQVTVGISNGIDIEIKHGLKLNEKVRGNLI